MSEIPRTASARAYDPLRPLPGESGVPPRAPKAAGGSTNRPLGLQQAGFPGEHPSGLEPLGRAILVEPYAPERDRVSKTIFIPDSVLQNEQALDVKVRLVSVGPLAWADEPKHRAAPGDIVLVAKHSGWVALGLDGKSYRFVNDRDVFGRVKEQGNG